MDCDTTGVEPDFALIKFKKLAGGGSFKIVNQSVPRALKKLGYAAAQVQAIVDYVRGTATLKSVPEFSPKELEARGLQQNEIAKVEKSLESVFDLRPAFAGHVIGAAALQRLGLDAGAKGKHVLAKLGYTDMALHRDGLKLFQPLIAGDQSQKIALPKDAKQMAEALRSFIPDLTAEQAQRMAEAAFHAKAAATAAPEQLPAMTRRKLPAKRYGITQEAKVGGNKVFLRTGEYGDGTLGEIFIDMHKEGAALRSVMNCFAMLVSIALQ